MIRLGSRLLLFFLPLWAACHRPTLQAPDAKVFGKKYFQAIKDTSEMGVLPFHSAIDSNWFVAFNREQDTARVIFFTPRSDTPHHVLTLRDRPPCAIKGLSFMDVNADGKYDMVLDILFDYGLGYRKKQTLVYEYPFDEFYTRPILEVQTYEEWNKVTAFDSLNNPTYVQSITYDASLRMASGQVSLEGLINGTHDLILQYAWDSLRREYHPFTEKNRLRWLRLKGKADGNPKGPKRLMQVESEHDGCAVFQLIDKNNRLVPVPPKVGAAMECAGHLSLSPNGRYLVFEDSAQSNLCVLDFNTGSVKTLLKYTETLEGISKPLWSKSGNSLAVVAINQEEYPENTRVFVYRPSGDEWPVRAFPVKVRYECEGDVCTAIPGVDFYFENDKALIYRTYKQELDERQGIRRIEL